MKFTFDMLVYGAPSLDEYNQVKEKITHDNKIRLNFFAIITSLALIICFFNSFFDDSSVKNRFIYLGIAIIMAFMAAITSKPVKIKDATVDFLMYIFMEIYYFASIFIATVVSPEVPTISFVVLLFAIPLLFTMQPVYNNILMIFNVAIYFILAHLTQTIDMLRFNALDVNIYGLLSLIIGTYTMCIKIDRYLLIERNIELSKLDQLTGLPNRRCFEINLEAVKESELDPQLHILMFDINGLKETNDTYGHAAGDSLIKAAADAIQNVFGPYGTSYRIGGDEFITIASLPVGIDEIEKRLSLETGKYTGNFGEKLTISVGGKKVNSIDEISETIKEADERMYESKRRFYKSSGVDRRKS